MDAPAHFYYHSYGIDKINLNHVCGDVSIVDFSSKLKGDVVELCDVENITVTDRMIFAFGWFKYWRTNKYYDDFPYFSKEAVQYLIENGMYVMALDTPWPDSVRDIGTIEDSPNHKMLLKKGVVLIEYLTNTGQLINGKRYSLIALPLKLEDADGSPARVIPIVHREGDDF